MDVIGWARRQPIWDEARRARDAEGALELSYFTAAALFLTGVLDTASTEMALSTGRAMEMNPIVSAVQEALGPYWVAPKLGTHLALVGLALWHPNRPTLIALALVAVFISAAVLNNLWVYVEIQNNPIPPTPLRVG